MPSRARGYGAVRKYGCSCASAAVMRLCCAPRARAAAAWRAITPRAACTGPTGPRSLPHRRLTSAAKMAPKTAGGKAAPTAVRCPALPAKLAGERASGTSRAAAHASARHARRSGACAARHRGGFSHRGWPAAG